MTKLHVVIGITAFSMLHFGAMAVFMFVAMGLGMNRFDSGGDPSIIETITRAITNILVFPGFYVYSAAGSRNDLFEWVTVIANSVLWGAAFFGFFLLVRRMSRSIIGLQNAQSKPS
jgi:hypothetical protein